MSDKEVLIKEAEQSEGFSNTVAPPPYGYSPQYDQNHQIVKIVNAQPGTTAVGTVYYTPPSDNFLVLSILLTVICGICGSWIGMCCTVPAIIFAVHARDAESRGDLIDMKKKRTASLVFNIVGFICGLLITIASWVWLYLYYTGSIWRIYDDGEGSDHDFDSDS